MNTFPFKYFLVWNLPKNKSDHSEEFSVVEYLLVYS